MSEERGNPFGKFAPAAAPPIARPDVAASGNPFAQFAAPVVQPTLQDPTTALDAFWKGMVHTARSTAEGVGQLASHLAGDVGLASPEFVKRSDEEARAWQQHVAGSPEAAQHPWAYEAGKIGGDIAVTAPLMAMPGMGAVTTMGRLAAGTLLGAEMGVLQPIAEPGQGESDFYAQKTWNALRGGVAGAAGGAVGEVVGSPLAKALARGADSPLVGSFRRLVQPSKTGVTDTVTLGRQDQRIITAFDQVVRNKDSLQLTDEAGKVVTGQLPTSLRQFGQALDQIKKNLYSQYDGLLKSVPGAPTVDLRAVAADIRAAVGARSTERWSPSIVKKAEKIADDFEKQGTATLVEAQGEVEHLNAMTDAYWRNPKPKDVKLANVQATASKNIRGQLDKIVNTLQGPTYQDLRSTYGAVRDIEKNVTAAVQREANRRPGMGDRTAMIGEFSAFAHSLFTHDFKSAVLGTSIAAGRAYTKWLNQPNRVITNLFKQREAVVKGHVNELRKLAEGLRSGSPVVGGVAGTEAARGDTLTEAPR